MIDNLNKIITIEEIVTSDLKEELQKKAKELGKRNIEELLFYAMQKI
ncbi:hypothetical protein [Priestia megaterium]|nr:hypothetical protein [Priestia megaterium]MCF8890974.1 hypothetical protein [Priestia megaterium]